MRFVIGNLFSQGILTIIIVVKSEHLSDISRNFRTTFGIQQSECPSSFRCLVCWMFFSCPDLLLDIDVPLDGTKSNAYHKFLF